MRAPRLSGSAPCVRTRGALQHRRLRHHRDRVLAPFAVDPASVHWPCRHESLGNSAVPVTTVVLTVPLQTSATKTLPRLRSPRHHLGASIDALKSGLITRRQHGVSRSETM